MASNMASNVCTGDVRNDIYLTLRTGEFNRGSKTTDKNVEMEICVCDHMGKVLQVSCDLVCVCSVCVFMSVCPFLCLWLSLYLCVRDAVFQTMAAEPVHISHLVNFFTVQYNYKYLE